MTLVLALVPLLSLLALLFAYFVFTSVRSSGIAELRRDYDQFIQSVVEQDDALQQSLLDGLLSGTAVAECLEEFMRGRAALVSSVCPEQSAGWSTEELQGYAQARLSLQATTLNHRFATRMGIAVVSTIGACAVITAVLYNFHAGAESSDALPTSGYSSSSTSSDASDPFVGGARSQIDPTQTTTSRPSDAAPPPSNKSQGSQSPETTIVPTAQIP